MVEVVTVDGPSVVLVMVVGALELGMDGAAPWLQLSLKQHSEEQLFRVLFVWLKEDTASLQVS